MVKAIAADIGPIALDEAEFVEFHNYNLDTLGEIGAVKMGFIAKEAGTFYEVHGEFLLGVGNETDASKEFVLVNVTSVSELKIDEDGDLGDEDFTNVAGVSVSLPVSTVMTVFTVVNDTADIDDKYDELENLIKGA
jgi:hypothetical protein